MIVVPCLLKVLCEGAGAQVTYFQGPSPLEVGHIIVHCSHVLLCVSHDHGGADDGAKRDCNCGMIPCMSKTLICYVITGEMDLRFLMLG